MRRLYPLRWKIGFAPECGLSSRRLEAAANVRFGSWLRENVEIEFANGNFVSTSINLKNKSAGEGCRDKTIEKTILRAFRARTFSRSQGAKPEKLHASI